jgi:prepilin-type N-terminal cleavage/methylation domain-containing protein
MEKRAGFTLTELMVVIAIVGILSATVVPLYRTYRQRTHGAEATFMLRQLMDAEVIYFLEHETFFPQNQVYTVTHAGMSAPADAVDKIKEALKVYIPAGHRLDFTISATPINCTVIISSTQNSFALFGNGDTFIRGDLDTTGKIVIF